MSIENWITLVLAIYGALLSSILGIRELRKEKRNIAIFLEYLPWYEAYSIVITNVGYRPITLMELFINVPATGPFRQNLFIDEKGNSTWPFPVTLNDGQHISISIPQNLCSYISEAEGKINLVVFDAEGTSYNKYSKITHDTKYSTYS